MLYNKLASEVYYISKKAGDIILGYYDDKIEAIRKEDNSPVTIADRAASDFIVKELKKLTPDIAVVSEENSKEENSLAFGQEKFWMVDPLDGTKSFIKKTGEFTVNIALIENKKPVGGAIYVPVQRVGYLTAEDGNAYKQDGDGLPIQIRVRPVPDNGVVVVASLSHRTPETDEYINNLPKVSGIISASSSLKLCMVAEGKADIYPRFGPTMEWDIAAGHAILNASGGKIINPDGSVFSYGKIDFRNGNFVAMS